MSFRLRSDSTRATYPVLTLTAVTGKDRVPQFARATARDGTEHFSLLERDFVRVQLQKPVAMLPQTVGDSRHGLTRTTKQFVNHLPCVNRRRVGQMQINHRRLQAAVTEI